MISTQYIVGEEVQLEPRKSCNTRGQKFLSLRRVSTELIWVMTGESEFSTAYHLFFSGNKGKFEKKLV